MGLGWVHFGNGYHVDFQATSSLRMLLRRIQSEGTSPVFHRGLSFAFPLFPGDVDPMTTQHRRFDHRIVQVLVGIVHLSIPTGADHAAFPRIDHGLENLMDIALVITHVDQQRALFFFQEVSKNREHSSTV